MRLITDVTNTALGREEMAVACRLYGTNSLKERVMCHVDSLLGNDREISSYTTAVVK
jgi:hypothetical protein